MTQFLSLRPWRPDPGPDYFQKKVARGVFLCKSVYLIINKGTDMNASQLRKRLQQRKKEAGDLLRVLMRRRSLVRGSVYKLRRKCGKEGCRCQDGHLHESWVLSVSEKGKKRMRAVPKGKRTEWQAMADRYRRFRRARARLVKLFDEIIKLVDEL